MTAADRACFERVAAAYPYPIAGACRRLLLRPPADDWQEWEALSRDVLIPTLQYLSHLLLSDLAATGRKPAALFHRIQAVLSRPTAGQYVGFLRDTARYYRDERLAGAVPELIDFLVAAEVDPRLLTGGQALLATLVDYRNLWAHGRPESASTITASVADIRRLTARLLDELEFLTRYPLELSDGRSFMGGEVQISPTAQPLVAIVAGEVTVRPLLLKLKGADLVLLEDLDVRERALAYRGTTTYARLTKKDLKSGDGARVFQELVALLAQVRAIDAVLAQPDWGTFCERAAVVTAATQAQYETALKYVAAWYVPRPTWEEPAGRFAAFLDSSRSLLAHSGGQGTGKSALIAHLATTTAEAGHAVLLLNAQRLSEVEVAWVGNPYPQYLARLLHYEAPFDHAAVARLVKGAPKGRCVVLFIDAINEVDGLGARWNRFRAMELLLEWVAAIAQPGLKVVLSFRLDAYEPLGYLRAQDLPPTLEEIAFTGDHPRQPWVWELEPFRQQQAAALYAKLQHEPRLGMAPAMTWETLRAGLGDKTGEFTANPLLFMVFLRAHHDLGAVATTDRDKLFLRYADKLTGSLEATRQSWWARAWGFLRNGSTTHKEQFLADLLGKMAEEGGAAFLVERLDPKNKRDRRLLAVVNPTRRDDRLFADLKDGGLVVEEKIEVEKQGVTVTSRRVTFVAELMATAMTGLVEKLERLSRTRRLVLFTLFLWGLLPALGWVMSSMLGRRLAWALDRSQASAPWAEFARQTMGASLAVMLKVVLPFLGLALIVFTVLTWANALLRLRPQHIGLAPFGTVFHWAREQSAFLARWVLLVAPGPVVWLVLGLLLGRGATDSTEELRSLILGGPWWGWADSAVLAAPALGLAAVVLLSIEPHVFAWVMGHLPRPAHPRLLREAARAVTRFEVEERPRHRHLVKRVALALTCTALGGCLHALAVARSGFALPPIPEATHSADWAVMRFALSQAASFDAALPSMAALASLGMVGISAFVLLYKIVSLWMFAVDSRRAATRRGSRPTRWWLAKYVGATYAAMTLATMVAVVAARPGDLRTGRARAEQFVADLGLRSSEYSILRGSGELVGLDLTRLRPGPTELTRLYGFRQLETLTLDETRDGARLDVTRLPRLKCLMAPTNAVSGLARASVEELTLFEPRDLRLVERSLTVRDLKLRGQPNASLAEIRARFPYLEELGLEEDAWARRQRELGHLPPYLVVKVLSTSTPRGSWPGGLSAHVVDLERAPATSTAGVESLERAWLPGNGLDPSVLRRATALRWLKIRIQCRLPRSFYGGLQAVVEQALPNLKTLELDDGGPIMTLMTEGRQRFERRTRAEAVRRLGAFARAGVPLGRECELPATQISASSPATTGAVQR